MFTHRSRDQRLSARRRLLWRVTYMLCSLSLVMLIGCQRGMSQYLDALPAEGTTLPAFSLPQLDGQLLVSTALMGRPAVVALWSSTCGASRLALAAIDSLRREYASRGVQVVLLADDTSHEAVRAVLDSAAIRLPVAVAAGQITALFAPARRFPWQAGVALPSFLVVDRYGVIQRRIVGVERDPAQRLSRVRLAVNAIEPVHQ